MLVCRPARQDGARRKPAGLTDPSLGARDVGPMGKMMKLLPAMRPAFSRYRHLLEAAGHGDKVV